jgi:hypothetical protein
MEGQEIVLHPSSSLQVTFQGRTIAKATSPSDNAKLQGRSHCITVYESVRGEIIASIEFHTNANHELDFCLVEQSLSLEDIPDLLVCQDPTEHIDRTHLRRQNSGDSDRFLKAVLHDYDQLGLEIEKQLQSFVPCERELPAEHDQASKKSVWSNWNPFASDKQRS